MNGTVKQFVAIAIVVLKSALAVLEVIPGNQGESQIRLAITVLEGLVAAS